MSASKVVICCKSFYPAETPVSLRMQGLVASLNKKYPTISITVLTLAGQRCDSLACEVFSLSPRTDGRPSSIFSDFSSGFSQIFLYVYFLCVRREKIDIVIGSTSFLGSGLFAYFLAILKHSKFILDLRDWPLHSINLISNKFIGRIYRIFLCLSFKLIRPKIITVTSPCHFNKAKKCWPESSVELILNGANDLVRRQTRMPKHLEQAVHELSHHKLLVYYGNFGYAQDLERVANWVSESASEFSFLLIGGGRDFARLREKFQTEKRIQIVPCIPRDCLVPVIELADGLVVSLKPGVLSEFAVPSKVFEYYLSDKPILLPKTRSLQSIIDSRKDELVYFYENNREGFEIALNQLSVCLNQSEPVDFKFRDLKRFEFGRKYQSDNFASLVGELGIIDG